MINVLHEYHASDDLDVRPILTLVSSDERSNDSGRVCRRYGCAGEAGALGFCRPCLDLHERDVRRNGFVYAVLSEQLAYVCRQAAANGISPLAVAELAIDALSVGDTALARALLFEGDDGQNVKSSTMLDDAKQITIIDDLSPGRL